MILYLCFFAKKMHFKVYLLTYTTCVRIPLQKLFPESKFHNKMIEHFFFKCRTCEGGDGISTEFKYSV